MRVAVRLCAVVLALSWSPASGATLGPLKTLTTVTVGNVAGLTGLNTFATSVALDRGLFKQYNIDLNVISEAAEVQACQSALSGSVDITYCTTNTQLAANTRGGDLIQIDNELRLPLPYQVVSSPATTSWAQLKGKTVLLSQLRSNVTYFFDMMARSNRMSHDDFQFAYGIPTSMGRLAAVKSGAVAATLVGVPASLIAEAAGFHILASTFSTPGLEADKFAGGGAVTTKRWAQQHSDVLVAYILALRDAMRWLYDPANKADVLVEIARDYKIESPAIAEEMYEIVTRRGLFSRDLCTPPSAEAGAIKAAVAIGVVPPGNYLPEDYAPNAWVELATHRRCQR